MKKNLTVLSLLIVVNLCKAIDLADNDTISLNYTVTDFGCATSKNNDINNYSLIIYLKDGKKKAKFVSYNQRTTNHFDYVSDTIPNNISSKDFRFFSIMKEAKLKKDPNLAMQFDALYTDSINTFINDYVYSKFYRNNSNYVVKKEEWTLSCQDEKMIDIYINHFWEMRNIYLKNKNFPINEHITRPYHYYELKNYKCFVDLGGYDYYTLLERLDINSINSVKK